MLLRRRRLRGSINGGARGLLGGADIIVLLNGALVEPAGTKLLVLRQELVWLPVLVAVEWQRRLWRGIIGDRAPGTRCYWLAQFKSS